MTVSVLTKAKKQITKMAQRHLGKQERVKISREPEPEGGMGNFREIVRFP